MIKTTIRGILAVTCMYTLNATVQAADSGYLNPVIGRILESHGIVGNATLERRAAANTWATAESMVESSMGAMNSFTSNTNHARTPGIPENSPDVRGIILLFADDEAKALSAQNLPPPDWLLDEIAALAPGLSFKRAMSMDAFVFDFPEPVAWEVYLELQESLRQTGFLEMMSPDYIEYGELIPNDPFFYYQWNLLKTGDFSVHAEGPVVGINAIAAWDLVKENNPTVVAVLDTGHNHPLPVEKFRMLPGYDFISDPYRARDGDGRDPDPSDMGDHRLENQCEHRPGAANSSWHGQEMTSIIAAPGNDHSGIAGIHWDARIVPVRVLGLCGGITSDIVDGMLWSVGLQVPGAPKNQNPARILNMSLGRHTGSSCNPTYMSALTVLKSFNVAIITSAGNDDKEAAFHQPSNCEGVISVGAVDHKGERTSYSNWSTMNAVHISAPGGDSVRHGSKGLFVATSDSGKTDPDNETKINWTGGTSAAAAHVSGALSLAMSVDPQQSTEVLLALMIETAQPFGPGSECELEFPKCGVGILDLETLVQGVILFRDFAIVRDFYHSGLQHYFRSGDEDEVAMVVSGHFGEWDEFDDIFLAWRDGSVSGTHPVCRFYGTPGIGPNSHFYTIDSSECEFIKQNDPGWTYEGTAFYAKRTNFIGACPRDTSPVYRFYNQKAHLNDSNHRYMTHLRDRSSMEATGWVFEGTAMCTPSF